MWIFTILFFIGFCGYMVVRGGTQNTRIGD